MLSKPVSMKCIIALFQSCTLYLSVLLFCILMYLCLFICLYCILSLRPSLPLSCFPILLSSLPYPPVSPSLSLTLAPNIFPLSLPLAENLSLFLLCFSSISITKLKEYHENSSSIFIFSQPTLYSGTSINGHSK